MAKIEEEYKAILQKQLISFILKDNENTKLNYEGEDGILQIFVSENKKPGEKFVIFTPFYYKGVVLKTSPGKITINNDLLEIKTQNNANCYVFKLLEKGNIKISNLTKQTPKKFLHICEVCGRTEILSPDEAWNKSWDYPPRNSPFRVLAPRTCGSCGIENTLWAKIMLLGGSFQDLTDKEKQTLSRIMGEPLTLIPLEDENNSQ